MRARQEPPASLIAEAEWQKGVVSRQQVLAAGMSEKALDRLVRSRVWSVPVPGVVHLSPAPLTFEAACWAGVLLGGKDACIAGEAAAHLLRFSDEPQTIEVVIPHHRRRIDVGRWTFRRTTRDVRTWVGNPPRLPADQVVLDLCAAQRHRWQHWILAAVNARATTVGRLRRALATRERFGERAELMALLADAQDGVRSALEVRYLRTVERPHGLPAGMRQQQRRRRFTDVEYLDGRVIVELDGRLGHQSEPFRDMRRDNTHQLQGAATLRYGYDDVKADPCRVARQVASLLRTHGWNGRVVSCQRCR